MFASLKPYSVCVAGVEHRAWTLWGALDHVAQAGQCVASARVTCLGRVVMFRLGLPLA